MEKDSENLFTIAEEAIKRKPNLNVIIVKRLPRYDRSSKDILGIKAKLSVFGNNAYDQLWIKKGSPKNIHIIELNINCDNSSYLRKLVYGDGQDRIFDGTHLRGPGGSRHFTYRAVQSLKPVLKSLHPAVQTGPVQGNKGKDDHSNCEQTRYMEQKLQQRKSYAQAAKSETTYNVPTSNYYASLNY